MASHVSIQPVGTPTPLPVQPLPPARPSAPAASAATGGAAAAPAIVELRPTPGSESAPPAPAPTAIGVAALGPATPTTEVPTASSLTFRVFARLSNGERIDVGVHGEEAAAKGEATALMRFLKEDSGDWPFLAGRFVRPEAIVSVDVVSG